MNIQGVRYRISDNLETTARRPFGKRGVRETDSTSYVARRYPRVPGTVSLARLGPIGPIRIVMLHWYERHNYSNHMQLWFRDLSDALLIGP